MTPSIPIDGFRDGAINPIVPDLTTEVDLLAALSRQALMQCPWMWMCCGCAARRLRAGSAGPYLPETPLLLPRFNGTLLVGALQQHLLANGPAWC